MLLNIYYIIGLLALLASTTLLLKFNRVYYLKEWIFKFKKINGKTPKLNEFRKKSDYNDFISFSVSYMVLITWFFIGLFTNNWFVFLFLIITNFLINLTIPKWNILHKFVILLKSFLDFTVILFLILNNFIWKFNILEFFNNF
jgi:hypothetical protein